MSSDSISTEIITNKIFIIRGQKVMLDRDLAELYGIETKFLKRAVRRNRARFPEDFMFELTAQESKALRYQSGTLEKGRYAKYASFVFTEQGVAMLSSVLNSEQAVLVNIAIMRSFVKLRETLSLHKELAAKLKELEGKVEGHDKAIRDIFNAIRSLMNPPELPKERIGFRP